MQAQAFSGRMRALHVRCWCGANQHAKRMFLRASKTPWWNGRSGKMSPRNGPRCDSKSLIRRHM